MYILWRNDILLYKCLEEYISKCYKQCTITDITVNHFLFVATACPVLPIIQLFPPACGSQQAVGLAAGSGSGVECDHGIRNGSPFPPPNSSCLPVSLLSFYRRVRKAEGEVCNHSTETVLTFQPANGNVCHFAAVFFNQSLYRAILFVQKG